MIPGYNEAWLKKIGYNEPPKTLAELEDVLTKFVSDDPDGNGRKDTYGISGRGKLPFQLFTSIFSAYGVSPYQFKLGADGKVVYGGITEETRKALKLLNKWFEAGLIDPEFITADSEKLSEKFASQRSAWSITWGGAASTRNPSILRNLHWRRANTLSPESRLSDRPVKRMPSPPAYVKALLLLGVQLQKDTVKRTKIEQILEYVATDPEGWHLTVYGEKGVNYDMKGDLVVARTEPSASNAGARGFYNPLANVDTSMVKYNTSKELLDFRGKAGYSGYVPLRDVIGPTVLTAKAKYWCGAQYYSWTII